MRKTTISVIFLCLLLLFTATAQAQTEEDNALIFSAFNESDSLSQDGGAKFGVIPEGAVIVSMSRDTVLPRSFNWSDVDGVNWMTPIEVQQYGACWAFSPIGVVEAKANIQTNNPTLNIDLSEQHLVSRCCDAGDNSGGWPEEALEFMKGGVCLEEEFPYTGRNSECTPSPGWEEDSWKVVDYIYIDNTTEDFKRAIIKHGPLVVILNAADIVGGEGRPNRGANHAVALVGYENGYWIIKDSKSSSSGVAGYKKVPYGQIERHNYAFAITGVSQGTGEWTDPVWAWSSTWWGNKVPPGMAIDNNPNTHWCSGSYQSFPKWIFFGMDEIVTMDKVRVMIFPSDLPMVIDIEVTNGTLPTDIYPYQPWEWKTVLSNFTVTEGGVFVEIPFPETINARYVKLWQTSYNEFGRNFGTCTEFDAHVI